MRVSVLGVHGQRENAEKGASTVELAVGALVLFAFVGGIFDFGVGLHTYNLLQFVSSTVSREFSAEVGSFGSGLACADVEAEARERARFIYEDRFGRNGQLAPAGADLEDEPTANYQITASLLEADGEPESDPRISIVSKMKLTCFFCIFFPRGITLSASSEIGIEDRSFQCES